MARVLRVRVIVVVHLVAMTVTFVLCVPVRHPVTIAARACRTLLRFEGKLMRVPLPLLFALALAAPVARADCPPVDWDAAKLQALKESKFAVTDAQARTKLANGLLDCLASPDPKLRDGIAFEAWSTWLRADQLDEATRRAALERLQSQLSADDPAGFERPFSALVLSEVARTDRIKPWLTPEEREALLLHATLYVASVRDYRGFVQGEGWRHGVAHGADLLMQLAMNPAYDKPRFDRILDAVAAQVAPEGQAYVFGEPERLARPVLFIAVRGLYSEAEWSAWLAKLAAPPPGGWESVFNDEQGLQRRHDLRAFLLGMYAQAAESTQPGVRALLPGLKAQLEAVP